MTALSIDPRLPEIVEALRARRALVLVAEPGAGKTTRVPPALLRSGILTAFHPAAVLLQPRRVAARAAAARIAEENGWTLGREVGYQVRFDRKIGRETRLRVVTEGVLTRQLLADPFLEGVGAVILDEFHERSLHTDLALALLREVRESVRDDLMLVVMSASLDAEPVARFLGDCPILRVAGRTYPVAIEFAPPSTAPLSDRVAKAVEAVLEGDAPGDVLVFLPGAEEIRHATQRLEPIARRDDLLVLPLHGRLPAAEQDRALRPAGRRKVILATNVAETSLTIEGVGTVIDSGLARFAGHDPARGLDRLELGRISRASATQRAGRAGRLGPGRCLRLWSPRDERGMPEFDVPEVRRVDLCGTVLALRSWGHADPSRFPWYEDPPAEHLAGAERLLAGLGALEFAGGPITEIGRQLLALPVHPRLGRLLVAAAEQGVLREGAALAAILSERDILAATRPREGARRHEPTARGRSDLLIRLDAVTEAERRGFAAELRGSGIDPGAARQVAQVRDDLIRQVRRIHGHGYRIDPQAEPDEDSLLRLVLTAYPDRVARRRPAGGATAVMVGGRGVRLDPESVVREAEFFLALDAREDRRGGVSEARVRIASEVRLEWIEEAFPGAIGRERTARFDEGRGRVVGVNILRYRDLIVREDAHAAVAPFLAATALAEALAPRAREVVRRDESAAGWLDRLECLRGWMPEGDWPSFSDAALAEVIALACHGRSTVEEVRRVSMLPLLKGQIAHAEVRAIDELAPETIAVPSGNRIRLSYEPGRPPVLAVRLQELFGWAETPRVAGGRVPVLLHLLGPNFRPVQVTDDLRSFWSGTYFQVRKDLRSRYPKHSWPENPWDAKPEAKGGRRTGGASS